MIPIKPKHIAKFWLNVKKFNSCWEWQGALTQSGYGRIWIKNKTYRAHRVSFYLFNDYLPDEKFICHTCDNPKCVNPAHLWDGSPKQNIQDCLSKKRRNKEKINKKKVKYHGVYFRKENKKWRVRYMDNYKSKYIGQFPTELEAAQAYDEAIRGWNKNKPLNEHKPLNFTIPSMI